MNTGLELRLRLRLGAGNGCLIVCRGGRNDSGEAWAAAFRRTLAGQRSGRGLPIPRSALRRWVPPNLNMHRAFAGVGKELFEIRCVRVGCLVSGQNAAEVFTHSSQ